MQKRNMARQVTAKHGDFQPISGVAGGVAKWKGVARRIIPMPGIGQMPAKEEKNDPLTFRVDGCAYRLSKRIAGRDVPYQVKFKFRNRQYWHSTRTNIVHVAKARATAYITQVRDGNWTAAHTMQSRTEAVAPVARASTFGQVVSLYLPGADGSRGFCGTTEDTARNNAWAMGKILKTVLRVDDPLTVTLTAIDKMLPVHYQDAMVKIRCDETCQDDETQRFARGQALNSSGSVIRQARSLFNAKSQLPDKYAEQGVIIGWKTEKKLHELRAYVGSLIYLKDPVAAMKFMRHASIRITEQSYARYGKVKTPDVL